MRAVEAADDSKPPLALLGEPGSAARLDCGRTVRSMIPSILSKSVSNVNSDWLCFGGSGGGAFDRFFFRSLRPFLDDSDGGGEGGAGRKGMKSGDGSGGISDEEEESICRPDRRALFDRFLIRFPIRVRGEELVFRIKS